MNQRRSPVAGNLLGYVSDFANLHVLVLGDAMLDSYLEGFTDRLCREAPVPVVTLTERKVAPGGAANTAANVASLGGRVSFLAVVGDDAGGSLLCDTLEQRGVSTEHLLRDPGRDTLAKHRILAGAQMLVRYDEGSTGPLSADAEDRLCRHLAELWPLCDAVIVSDYGYGIMTPRVLRLLAELQGARPKVLIVDAKDLPQYRALAVTAVKPNYSETVRLLGLPKIEGACARADQVGAYGEEILDLTGAQITAVTLDTEGALVFERGRLPYRTYAQPNPDSHAAGAGDTFVSTLTLALAAGANTPAAVELASAAAAVVVARPGTTCCSVQELWTHFSADTKFLAGTEPLLALLELDRRQCRRIVFTNGCFDILHRGHIAYLNQAKKLGDVLVVALNSDASVQRLKGPTRPINALEDRAQVLSALSCVDYIVAFEEDTPVDLLRAVRPDVYVKGGDYTLETLPEAPVVLEMGGRVEILPYIEERSTTGLIQRIRQVYALTE